MFGIPIMLYRLLGSPGNLKLRKRKGVAKLAFDDVGLTGLMGDVDADLTCVQPAMTLFVPATPGEVSEKT